MHGGFTRILTYPFEISQQIPSLPKLDRVFNIIHCDVQLSDMIGY